MLTIIGCGNSNRTDDGAGVRAAQILKDFVREHPKRNVQVFDAGTGGLDVMFHARGATRLIIIDANSSGSEPGAIFEVPGEELAADHEASYSMHDFRWNHALYAGRRIFKDAFPTNVTVYLIEAGSLDLGLFMTEAVAHAVEKVVARIKAIIAEYD